MRKLLSNLWKIVSTLETIRSLIQWIGISKIISAGGTIAVIIWSVFEHKPTPEIVVISIATFAIILWTSMGIVKLWERRRQVASANRPTRQENEPIPAILTPQLYNPKDDAVDHLTIKGRDYSALTILKGVSGCPIQYPLKLHNARPIPIELVGYTVNIILNDLPVQVVNWDKPNNQTSNGMGMGHPFYLKADETKLLNVPIVLAQMQTVLPESNPSWSVIGELRFQGDTDMKRKEFNFNNDKYVLLDSDWDYLRQYALPK